ncbi:tRNA epoxyqueuosine(34) reductase QueG [Sediminibacterium sp.]|uniref:tRNA epoxyqueuosine(34) reductase QueG n=1 Tax=Sediminibacterium sp. TaxID=1917865 RepID=UPI003F704BB2
MLQIQSNTQFVKSLAYELGFSYCGIAKAAQLSEDARKLEQWLNKGMHGKMQYMENHFDLRTDPRKLVPGAKSVITLLKNYYPTEQQKPYAPLIAKYAWGKDYHEVIRNTLKTFLASLRQQLGDINGRGFVDSAPVLERAWAVKSGLGWVGKNGNLIHKNAGSFFFIATLIVDISLEYDDPIVKDYCGTCTKCITACPTEAILPDKQIDGSKCISYYTIELKDAMLNEGMKDQFKNWIFGCDICQDICPWNRFSKPHQEPAFEPIPAILNLSTSEWEELTEETFKTVFRDSPLKRVKFSGIKRNLRIIQAD